MNDNNIYNQNEVKNKLNNFTEGKDYKITPSEVPDIKDYTFFNNRLKSAFGGVDRIPVRVWQEKYEDKNFSYRGHFEEGKDYYYSFQSWVGMPPANENGWRPISSEFQSWGNNYKSLRMSFRPVSEPKRIEPSFNNDEVIRHQKYLTEFQEQKHFWEMRLIEEQGGKGSDYLCQKWGANYSTSSDWNQVIESIKQSIDEYEIKIQFEKDWLAKNTGSQPQNKVAGCCCCGFKDISPSDDYCGNCGVLLCDEAKKGRVNLEKENQELRQQLAQVQDELARVLAELKKLTGKGNQELEEQQAENEKVINHGSEAEIKQQVQKSQALVQQLNSNLKTTAPNKKEPQNSSLPYLIGGGSLLLVAGLGGVVFWLKKRSRK